VWLIERACRDASPNRARRDGCRAVTAVCIELRFSLCISHWHIHGGANDPFDGLKTNRSQAVRLPKAVAFPEGVHDVEILKLGAGRLVVPVGKRWDDFFDHGPYASDDFMGGGRSQLAPERREESVMLQYMLDTDICIYVIKERTPQLRGRFNPAWRAAVASRRSRWRSCTTVRRDQPRPVDNLAVVESFAARLEVLPFSAKAAGHYGQLRAALERAGTPAGPHDMLIGAHARAEGLVVVTNNAREFARMPGVRAERLGVRTWH